MTRKLHVILVLLSALAFAASFIYWPLSNWNAGPNFNSGPFIARQGPNRIYILSVAYGNVAFQAGDTFPDRSKPATSKWRWFHGNAYNYAPRCLAIGQDSFWARAGPIRTNISLPYDSGGSMGPNAYETCGGSTRSFAIPLWLLAMLFSVPPIRFVRATFIRQGDGLRRGFDVTHARA